MGRRDLDPGRQIAPPWESRTRWEGVVDSDDLIESASDTNAVNASAADTPSCGNVTLPLLDVVSDEESQWLTFIRSPDTYTRACFR